MKLAEMARGCRIWLVAQTRKLHCMIIPAVLQEQTYDRKHAAESCRKSVWHAQSKSNNNFALPYCGL
jgi:hypothetical protein